MQPQRPISSQPLVIDLEYAFGKALSYIANLNHCIVPLDPSTLSLASSTFGDAVGIWGKKLPLIDVDSGPFVPQDDQSNYTESFKEVWTMDANQSVVDDLVKNGQTNVFSMFIPVSTPASVIKWMNQGIKDSFEYPSCINLVPDWASRLEWMYIPIDDDATSDMAIVITQHSSSSVFEKFIRHVYELKSGHSYGLIAGKQHVQVSRVFL